MSGQANARTVVATTSSPGKGSLAEAMQLQGKVLSIGNKGRAIVVVGTRPGAKPAGAVERSVCMIANGVAVNPTVRRVTLRGPRRTIELAVNVPTRLKKSATSGISRQPRTDRESP